MVARIEYSICKHFDHSVDVGARYYKWANDSTYIRKYDFIDYSPTDICSEDSYYTCDKEDLFKPIVTDSCIGESRGMDLDQCQFNGYLHCRELCNPCNNTQFNEKCPMLCEPTIGPAFGSYHPE